MALAPRARAKARAPKEAEASTLIKHLASERVDVKFINTGAQLINCVTSGECKGGWALGRMVNIIGDESTGKTLLAIECTANFKRQYPEGRIRYVETEAAFDEPYAVALGLPLDMVEFPNAMPVEVPDAKKRKPRNEMDTDEELDLETDESKAQRKRRESKSANIETIEDLAEDFEQYLDELIETKKPGIYIVDSWDMITSEAEQSRGYEAGTYGGEKPKKASELFRRTAGKMHAADVCMLIISQTRANISPMPGAPKKRRAGGDVLNFAASQIVWLREIGKIRRTINNEKRVVGIRVRMKCSKNKVSPPHRECDFVITFNYGIEDMLATYEWLKKHDKATLKALTEMTEAVPALKRYNAMSIGAQLRHRAKASAALQKAWNEQEKAFLPKRTPKY